MIKIAPSILAADPLELGRDARRMIDAGCDMLHVDVMDAHFVPNLSFSPATTEALHKRFPDTKLDVHLMMDNPGDYLDAFAEAGAWGITIHAEIPGDVRALLRRIRELGCSAGLSVKPGTPVEAVADLLPEIDLLLVMTVEPGFGGQKFQPAMIDKLSRARAMGYKGLLQTDGGVKAANLPEQIAAGLDVAVMGTAMFRSEDPARDMAMLHAL